MMACIILAAHPISWLVKALNQQYCLPSVVGETSESLSPKGQDLAGSWLKRHKTKRSRRSVAARKGEPESTRIEPCAAHARPGLRMSWLLRKQRLGPRWHRRPERRLNLLCAASPVEPRVAAKA